MNSLVALDPNSFEKRHQMMVAALMYLIWQISRLAVSSKRFFNLSEHIWKAALLDRFLNGSAIDSSRNDQEGFKEHVDNLSLAAPTITAEANQARRLYVTMASKRYCLMMGSSVGMEAFSADMKPSESSGIGEEGCVHSLPVSVMAK